MESVYIESTIPSYLAARLSRRELDAARQKITAAWWRSDRERYRLYSSIAVRAEISKGDTVLAKRRLDIMEGIPELDATDEIEPLANTMLRLLQIPPSSAMDATHLAFAIVHRIDYLLTWNCVHLANAQLQKTIFEYCAYHKIHSPVICTPESLTQILH